MSLKRINFRYWQFLSAARVGMLCASEIDERREEGGRRRKEGEELSLISFETENKAAFWVSNVRLSMVAHILEYFDARKTRERVIFLNVEEKPRK